MDWAELKARREARPAMTMTSVEILSLLGAENDVRLFAGITSRKLFVVAAIIHDEEDRVLLVRKRGTRFFMQPGGKYAPDEDLLTALARELREELGCELLPGAEEVSTLIADAANEDDFLIQATLFEARIAGDIAPLAEIEELRWVDPWSPGDLPLAPLTQEYALPLARRPRRR